MQPKITFLRLPERIVFERFHATKQVTAAVDKVRRAEHKALAEGIAFNRRSVHRSADFRLEKPERIRYKTTKVHA